MITKKIIADRILLYLQHQITLPDMVNWAEEALMNDNFQDDSEHTSRNILAHIGAAEVKAFGLTREDCEEIMNKLGVKLKVLATEV